MKILDIDPTIFRVPPLLFMEKTSLMFLWELTERMVAHMALDTPGVRGNLFMLFIFCVLQGLVGTI